MPTVIKEALTVNEIDDVLKCRFNIYEESGQFLSDVFMKTKRISDHFDVFPDTINILAYKEGNAIGTIRAIKFDEGIQGLDYDYSEAHQNLKGLGYIIDTVAITKNYGMNHDILRGLFKTLLNLLAKRKGHHIFISALPNLDGLATELGFFPLGPRFKSPKTGREVRPLSLKIGEYYSKFTETIPDKEILRFQETFYNILYDPGEIFFTQGEKGTTAYFIESGEVEIIIEKKGDLIPIKTLGPGSLIGEIGLMTSDPRTASILAKTNCSCLAFDRGSFLEIMKKHPTRMLDMFKIFVKRLKSANDQISRLNSEKES